MRKLLVPSALFVALGACSSALAQDTVYTDPNAFAAAATINNTVTFDGIAPANGFTAEGTAFTLSGVSFSTPTSTFYINDAGFYGTPYGSGGYLTATGGSVDEIDIALPNVTAISFNYGGLFGPVGALVQLSDGSLFNLSTNDSITGTSSLDFAGITSTTQLTSISLILPDMPNYNAIDNLAYGDALPAPVPEPSTLALALTGLAGCAGAIRRKLRR